MSVYFDTCQADFLGVTNVIFELSDAENLDFPEESFDAILCANTFPWILNKENTLQVWRNLLIKGGKIGIHTPAETAYVGDVVLQEVFSEFGIAMGACDELGTIPKCNNFLSKIGFSEIEIQTEQHGNYISIEDAKGKWSTLGRPLPPRVAEKIRNLTPEEMEKAKRNFETNMEARKTERGVWNDFVKNKLIADGGSVQNIPGIPDDIKALYKTVWEIKQKDLIDLAADRGAFVDQSQSMNVHMADASFGKLTSMHFYAWKKGLKTGLYYLRTRAAADAIKFTVEVESTVTKEVSNAMEMKQSIKKGIKLESLILTDEQENDIRQAKLMCSLQNKDDCLMCGS